MNANISTDRPRLRRAGLLFEVFSTLFFIVAVYSLAEMSIPRSNLDGPSMQPNFYAGQYLLISRVHYLFGEPQPNDVAVFQAPGDTPDDPRLIKRVIGVPRDTIEFIDQVVYRNGLAIDEPYINEPCEPRLCPDRRWELGPDQYFMMGDNRNHSRDSRVFGPVRREAIVGEAVFRYWPPERFGTINTFR
ncbi:MAG: signal peptidase I [Anaerolineae bacterium]|jgi:signal peptidase I|nr:signal peptidase I [Anaerolineae bacterium]